MKNDTNKSSDEFLFSGLAAVGAIILTNPLDVIRTRLQLQMNLKNNKKIYNGMIHGFYQIIKYEGMMGLQRGLYPAILLQFTNVSIRFGIYDTLKKKLNINPFEQSSFYKSFLAGSLSGAIAGIVSCPFFLLKNRFQSQSNIKNLIVSHQYMYTSLSDSIIKIYSKEGLNGFYKGLTSFIPRVMIASSVQLSFYDYFKNKLKHKFYLKDNILLHIYASFLTGIIVVGAMQPFDFISTRIMSQKYNKYGKGLLYSSPLDVIKKTIRNEGIFGMYKGAFTSYIRFGPYCIFVFLFLEQLRKLNNIKMVTLD